MSTFPTGPTSAAKPAPPPPRDSVREVFETIVFVVSLVLMLKLFVVEAFVIPTGSMAETLYGYQKIVTCPECAHEFPVNASNEVQPWDGHPRAVTGSTCPNCRHTWLFSPKEQDQFRYRSGDRVLVLKPLYSFGSPRRGDVVVFKYPVDPQVNFEAQNYIKRLWGLGGETLAIWRGDLYVCQTLDYPAGATDSSGDPLHPQPDDPRRIWEGPAVDSKTGHRQSAPYGTGFVYHNADVALQQFEASRRAGFPAAGPGFTIVRKADEHALAMRRLVYDNDHQSERLARKGVPPRWAADGPGWAADSAATPRAFAHSGDALTWVRYRHRVSGPATDIRPQDDGNLFGRRQLADDWVKVDNGWQPGLFPPQPITNFLGYNAGIEGGGVPRETGNHWVGDLMVECRAAFSGPGDEVVLELSEGANRYQARFAGGNVTLTQTGPGGRELATRPTGIAGGGHDLRFANFDDRLRVWVDGAAVDFGDDANLPPGLPVDFASAVGALAGAAFGPLTPRGGDALNPNLPDGPTGFTLANDVLAPAGVGATGGVEVRHLRLWQDTFFTPAGNQVYAAPADPVDTFYVHPGHYLCLGDNSGQSSDSRKWGLVPDRLMLGKAVFVFFPLSRIGFIQ